jgi:protease IV
MKEFFKYTLATITGIIVTSLIGFLFLMMVIGAIIASTEKTVVVENQSMLSIKLDNLIVDRAPNDPFSDLNIPGFGSAKKIGLDQYPQFN